MKAIPLQKQEVPFHELVGSEIERSFVTHWERHADPGTPDPRRELRVIPGRSIRCDLVWVKEGIITELDGGQFKSGGGRHNTDADRDKVNQLTLLGWTVLRYSGSMLSFDPLGVIGQICDVVNGVKPVRNIMVKPAPKRRKKKEIDYGDMELS